VLRRADFFGQYGRIAKVVVNRNHSTGGGDSGSSGRSGLSHETSASAYITFVHKEDARACINAVKK
jgi:CCR4-NOT transcription complex subunit 4